MHTPTGVPGKVDAATMTPIDCAESKGANPLPHGYSPEQDDLLPGLMRCPKCGKMKTGDGTQVCGSVSSKSFVLFQHVQALSHILSVLERFFGFLGARLCCCPSAFIISRLQTLHRYLLFEVAKD